MNAEELYSNIGEVKNLIIDLLSNCKEMSPDEYDDLINRCRDGMFILDEVMLSGY